jgi:hypothetical protein
MRQEQPADTSAAGTLSRVQAVLVVVILTAATALGRGMSFGS